MKRMIKKQFFDRRIHHMAKFYTKVNQIFICNITFNQITKHCIAKILNYFTEKISLFLEHSLCYKEYHLILLYTEKKKFFNFHLFIFDIEIIL